ncbi:MAG: hypothetical protein FJW20_10945 [Acidimicrobiia bacterium]|nr:hypothetical protein [Acidimicrobiia bacterium]
MEAQAVANYARSPIPGLPASAYTWSKTMEALTFLNAVDPMPYETIADLDRPHRIALSGIWEIPVGKKRKFGAGLPGPAKE